MPKRYFPRQALNSVLLIIFLLVTLFTTLPTPLAKTATVEQSTNNCLWSIQSPSNTVYLLGSLHVLNQEAYPLHPAIERAFASSQRVVFETDIAAMQDPAMQAKMLELGMYPAGQDLFQNLPSDTRQKLEKKLKSLGLPPEAFSRFKPWFVALSLTTSELMQMGYNPQYGVDFYFFGKAQSKGKEIGYLEAPEYQINLLGKMAEKDQNDFLRQTLKDLEMVNELAGDLVKNWKTGNTEKLHELLHKSFEDYPGLNDRLLIQRNLKWVDKIKAAIGESENVLFVVGAGHLVGPESVVDLLGKAGHEVIQQ